MSFQLTEEDDIIFLDANFPGMWVAIEAYGNRGLIIKDYILPNGYKTSKVNLMILIPLNYPPAKLDMFYTMPNIERSDGKAIKELTTATLLGENWQRWSRHYDWNPEEDSLVRHIRRVEVWLRKETQR